MSKPSLGAGDVIIELDGEEVTLRPNLKAAQNISRAKGGISGAIEAVGRCDFDTIVSVVALGTGAEGREARQLPDKVYATGLADLVGPVIEYLSRLANGGRPIQAGGGEEDENPPS